MIQKSFFEKHHKRLVTEALTKAALCGLLVGFCANFLAALAAWIFDFGGVLFAVAVGVAVAVITGAVLYFVKFKPSVQDLAQRVDRLGLEEQHMEIMDVKIPMNTIPITPGRNLALILEVAAMNNRQRKMGYNAALEFTEQMNTHFAAQTGNNG